MNQILRRLVASGILTTSAVATAVASDPGQNNTPSSGTAYQAIGGQGTNAVNPKNEVSIPAPISQPVQTGLFPGIGNTLLDDGIDIHGLIFDHFLANTTAGPIPGNTTNLGVAAPAVDIDLNKIAGIRGATVHVEDTIFFAKNNNPNSVVDVDGVINAYQTLPTLTSSTLSVLSYEQMLLNDKLDIEIGRTNIHRSFFIPNGLDPFNGISTTLAVDGDLVPIPFPVWAARAAYHLTPTWFLQGGVYEDIYIRPTDNGYPLGATSASGAIALGEVNYRSEFENARYPANMELGFLYDSRSGQTNLKGSGVPYVAAVDGPNYGNAGVFYFQGQKVLWRGAAVPKARPANIAIYGSVDAAVQKPQPIDMDAIVGMTFTGFIPGRLSDVFGVEIHYQRLSAAEANHETQNQMLAAGPGQPQSRNNYGFETTASIAITRSLSIAPYVQYFVHPDGYVVSLLPRRPSDGFITGATLILSIGRFLGTSKKPF